jgi:hypothetical protein
LLFIIINLLIFFIYYFILKLWPAHVGVDPDELSKRILFQSVIRKTSHLIGEKLIAKKSHTWDLRGMHCDWEKEMKHKTAKELLKAAFGNDWKI